MTETVQNVLSGVVGAAGATVYFVAAHWPKIKAGFQAATQVLAHLENNQAAVVAAKETVLAAAPGTDQATRELLIKDAVRDALGALKIEAANVDPVSRVAIVKYAQAKLPDEAKPLVAPALDALLQAIVNGVATAEQHDAIKSAVNLKTTA